VIDIFDGRYHKAKRLGSQNARKLSDKSSLHAFQPSSFKPGGALIYIFLKQ
jgi:hypothetical protein